MGIFDNLFKKNSSQNSETKKVNSNQFEASLCDYAVRLINSENSEDYYKGRDLMIKLADNPNINDKRVFMWMAKEYEKGRVFSSAAYWYKRAYQAGELEAKAGYERCYNPYHIDEYFNITGERSCGTPHINSYVIPAQEKQRKDYEDAIEKLNNKPTKEDAIECLRTIRLIASAYGCSVPEAQVWMGDFFETVEHDLEKAAEWFKIASDNESADGARCYADMLMSGRGVEKNAEEAVKYYKLAADRGQIEAQFVMGQYYQMNGEFALALKYFHMSMDGGYAPAKEKVVRLERGEGRENASGFERALSSKFNEIILNNKYDSDGLVEYFADIYQPEDFCKQAYDYCNGHYDKTNTNKIIFEYCMTAFYGCICTVAMLKENPFVFTGVKSIWTILYKHINVEFTDSNAERMLGTKRGEDKAEEIYSKIHDFIDVANAVIKMSEFDEKVCLYAMALSYKLGMLVAKNEIDIPTLNFEREYLVRDNYDEYLDDEYDEDEFDCYEDETDCVEEDENFISPNEFYAACVEDFHTKAMSLNVANRGLIFIPELIELGEKTILAYLRDPFFQAQCNGNANQYYYLIMSLSIDAGICFATKWHEDFSSLKQYVDKIIKNGPADDANDLMDKYLPKDVLGDQGNKFFNEIYSNWLEMHEPYWDLEDPRKYTFNAMVAAYQLGISMILEKFGY